MRWIFLIQKISMVITHFADNIICDASGIIHVLVEYGEGDDAKAWLYISTYSSFGRHHVEQPFSKYCSLR